MNSNQRVKAIFEKKKPDRPALGFFSIDSDIASKVLGRETYWRAKAKCQIAFWEGRRDEVVQSWITDGIELYRKLDILDIIPVCTVSAGKAPPKDYDPNPPQKIDDNTWQDKQGRVFKYSPITKDITMIHDPDAYSRSFDIEDELWEGKINPPDETIFEAIDAIITEFKDKRFILGTSAGEFAWLLLGGMERGFMEIAMNPEKVRQIYLSRIEEAIAHDKYHVRPGQDGVLWGTDLANQTGPMINPLQYKELFLDGYKKRINSIKNMGQNIAKHACGNNWPLLNYFVEAGIDCYQSIQQTAEMDIFEVDKKYGDKFALWGGISVEKLMHGEPEDIRKDVDKLMSHFGQSNNFILGTSHSVAVGTNYDNFMAMLDQFSKWI